MKKFLISEEEKSRILKMHLSEQNEFGERERLDLIIKKWYDKTNNPFFIKFAMDYPTQSDFDTDLIDNYLEYDFDEIDGLSDAEILDNYWTPESEIDLLESNFEDIPDTDTWVEFKNDLGDSGW